MTPEQIRFTFLVGAGSGEVPMRRPLGFLTIAGLAALAGAALSILGAYTGAQHFLLDLFGQFAIQAVLTALALTILFAARRRPLLACLSASAAIAGYFAMNIPAPVPPCTDMPTHRVLFFNVWDENRRARETIDFIAHQNADTVVLAEVNPRFQAALGELRNLYPYSVECPPASAHCQFYVYSREPLEETGKSHLQTLVELGVKYPEATLGLAGIHAMRPIPPRLRWWQRRQADMFAHLIAKTPAPRLVVGDFNAVGWGAIIRLMSRVANVKPLPSPGTWPAPMPWPLRIPIDQVLVGDGVLCAKKTVGPRAFSDHRPIWVDFALKSSASAASAP